MGLFDLFHKEPVFLKESSQSEQQLIKLRELAPYLNEEGQKIINRDIKCLEYGIVGEKNIGYELKNSHMPMYILHDVYLSDGELSAQIDYLVFTKKLIFVLESKNLYGNIEITNNGDFIRTTEFNGKKKREGIYSPVTQNQRHLALMKKLRIDSKKNIISKRFEEREFDMSCIPLIVLANPKTILDARYAKADVKNQVIRGDQLIKKIKEMYDNSNNIAISDKQLEAMARFYLSLHRENTKDYCKKYEQFKKNPQDTNNQYAEKEFASNDEQNVVPIEETDLYRELKEYRLNKSREEKMKAYYLFNDSQLMNLVQKMPKNRQELLQISGFGQVKVEKYGDDILGIITKYL